MHDATSIPSNKRNGVITSSDSNESRVNYLGGLVELLRHLDKGKPLKSRALFPLLERNEIMKRRMSSRVSGVTRQQCVQIDLTQSRAGV